MKIPKIPSGVAYSLEFLVTDSLRFGESHTQTPGSKPDVVLKYALNRFMNRLTGIDFMNQRAYLPFALDFWVPMLISIGKHKLANYLGVNRDLKDVPFLAI